MKFADLMKKAESGEVMFDESWAQGRSGFGGLVAALLFSNMVKLLSDDRPVRSLQISFVGPVSANIPLQIESKVLREGKSVTQVHAQGIQGGQVQISMLAAFGHPRSSSIEVVRERQVFPESPQEQTSLDGLGNFVPAFTKYFDFRYCTPLPFAGTDETVLRGFLKFAEAPERIGVSELLAIIDAWPPAPLPMLKRLAPASSLSWTVEFIHPLPALQPEEYCQYEAQILHAADGYGHTAAKIWNRSGELIALSQQTVTVFG